MVLNRRIERGFSLIELMVVVAIIGVISAIAFPSYQNYTCDTFRSQAVADLKVCSLALERYYSDGFTYENAVVDDTDDSLCVEFSPASGGQAKFDITLESATLTSFLLHATPAENQSCGSGTTITLTADGTIGEE